MKQFQETMNNMAESICTDVIREMQSQLKMQDKVVRGVVRDSLQYDKETQEVYSTFEYISNIEYGRRAGAKKPPLKPIAEWLMNKMGLSKEEAYSVAPKVAHNISKYGIKGSLFVEKSLNVVVG